MTNVDKTGYRQTLKSAIADYEELSVKSRELEVEKREVDDLRAKLRRIITGLGPLCGESPYFDPLGITHSCIDAMSVETQEVSTNEVVSRLEDMGYDFSQQKNPAASVHTVLSRLADKGTITKVVGDDNAIAWRGPKYDPDEAVPF